MSPDGGRPGMGEASRLGDILMQVGLIDEFQLKAALDEHVRSGHRLGITLVRLGFLEEPDLVKALATQLDLPIARLDGKRVDPEILDLIPFDLAEKHSVLPLFVKNGDVGRELYLGMEDPCDGATIEEIAQRANMPIKPVLCAASEMALAIDRLYRPVLLEDEHAGDPGGDVLHDLAGTVAPAPARPAEADTRVILQALTQLLIERELIDRADLVERVRELEERKG